MVGHSILLEGLSERKRGVIRGIRYYKEKELKVGMIIGVLPEAFSFGWRPTIGRIIDISKKNDGEIDKISVRTLVGYGSYFNFSTKEERVIKTFTGGCFDILALIKSDEDDPDMRKNHGVNTSRMAKGLLLMMLDENVEDCKFRT